MDHDFWIERWRSGRIGFHLEAPNPMLLAHAEALGAGPRRVLVPLCGKTEDMAWLAAQGHTVVGVELAVQAVEDFFRTHGLVPTVTPRGALRAYTAGPFTLWAGDFFEVTRDDVGPVDALYDRAALIALPPSMRAQYAAHVRALLPDGPRGLVITLEYPEDAMQGPPFSVPEAELRALYPDTPITLLATREATLPPSDPGGLPVLERCFALRVTEASGG